MKDKFPNKTTEDSLEKELEYCKPLISVIKGDEELCSYPKVQEKLNLLKASCFQPASVHKILLYFDGLIRYNEVSDKSEIKRGLMLWYIRR